MTALAASLLMRMPIAKCFRISSSSPNVFPIIERCYEKRGREVVISAGSCSGKHHFIYSGVDCCICNIMHGNVPPNTPLQHTRNRPRTQCYYEVFLLPPSSVSGAPFCDRLRKRCCEIGDAASTLSHGRCEQPAVRPAVAATILATRSVQRGALVPYPWKLLGAKPHVLL